MDYKYMISKIGAASPDVKELVSQLTVDEKATLLAGQNLWETVAVPRINIPSLKVSDGPNGARGGKFQDGVKAACFPAGTNLAASWDRSLVEKVGKALAEETKTKGALVLLGPTVCPHRHPLGGRNFESFSEDPLLAGVMATHYIEALQSEGVGATIKHFVANEQESKRFTIDETVDQRALREIYMKPFEIAIKAANPWAVMSSYNLVNGVHSDSSKPLLQTVLRDQWGWDGLVMSDWGGTNSTAESIQAGLDLEMPGPALFRSVEKVKAALDSGKLDIADVDKRVTAVLEFVAKAGKFDNPETPDEEAIDRPEHRQIIREVGAQGIVLLKNKNNILPLQKEKTKSVAMLGLAKECLSSGGGSATVNSHYKITPWDAMVEAVGKDVELKYSKGASVIRQFPPITENIFDNEGKPGLTLHGVTAGDKEVTQTILKSQFTPMDAVDGTMFKSVKINGTFKPTVTGSHYISFIGIGATTITINGETIFTLETDGVDPMAFLFGVAPEEKKQYYFEAGKEYNVVIESYAIQNNTSGLSMLDKCVGLNLGFMLQDDVEADLIAPAVAAAKESDIALVFTGHTYMWETEGSDRPTMDLPADGSLDRLITEVAKVNPNTIVINSTGSAISMPWLDSIAGFLQVFFPGQEAGNSIADVVLGKVNPGGKLPATFPKSVEVCPAYGNFPGDLETLKVTYEEGIYIGYRHFDKHPEDVLFPFGHGLSYTTFEVSDIKVQSPNGLIQDRKLEVEATVTNTGSVAGSEVVQLYAGSAHDSEIDTPVKQLADFAKVTLQPGEKKTVKLAIKQDNLAYWVEDKTSWVVEEGAYTAFVGTSSAKIAGRVGFEVSASFEYGP